MSLLDPILTAAIRFGERHERTITILGGAWFVISCASWIPQLGVPEVPYLTDRNSWMFSGAWNGIWWGAVHPALEKHREKLEAADKQPQAISRD